MSSGLFELFHSDVSMGESLLYALIGYCVVFLMLVILIFVIQIMAKVVGAISPKAQPAAPQADVPKETPKEAPGSAGSLILEEVSDRDAAMIMAIVADSLNKQVNELRFKSIRRVKEEQDV